ncbi:MAG: thiamine pyrophosphate-dependent dehydrogenase E1 component subunit alpha [Burkholderiales bacterium]|nr:thiamine pyrophosphate-dependent dehydrogenase E1 component subunit alpha [Burkholderiales bacterium]
MDKANGRGDLRAMLERMLLIRAYEEKAAAMQAAGQAAGTCTSVGQEASAVGVVSALGEDDLILTNHRSAGHLLARGADPARIFAEVLGKATGYCKGKSGSLHISAKELGVVLTSTIVGAELSLASGVGLALSMRERGGVAACFFGDGAACEGAFHESLNLASVWKLPILYVCENNQWQAFVHRRETMPMDHISHWAVSHGLAAATVDGNDVEAVYRAAQAGIAQIRASGKPYFLETYTYRQRGHYEPDDQSYVDKQELATWRARDPIDLLQQKLGLSVTEIQAARGRAAVLIETAWSEAVAAPYPALSELTNDVYA